MDLAPLLLLPAASLEAILGGGLPLLPRPFPISNSMTSPMLVDTLTTAGVACLLEERSELRRCAVRTPGAYAARRSCVWCVCLECVGCVFPCFRYTAVRHTTNFPSSSSNPSITPHSHLAIPPHLAISAFTCQHSSEDGCCQHRLADLDLRSQS